MAIHYFSLSNIDRLETRVKEVLYLDNRVAVSRTANQSEDIKVIIQL